MPENGVYLIGFMGAGKTSVGQVLAEMSGMPVIDTDQYIEEQMGMTISDLFLEKGEAHFRTLETEALFQLPAESKIVTTGGGIVLKQENRTFLKSSGTTVFLQCHPEVVIDRIGNDPTRPLLANKNLPDIIEMYEGRLPYYEECASIVIDTSQLTITETAEQIMERIILPARQQKQMEI